MVDHIPLERFAAAVTARYDWPTTATDEGMASADGNAGPVFLLRPEQAFGWGPDMARPTCRRRAEVVGHRPEREAGHPLLLITGG